VKAIFFDSAEALRGWLASQHEKARELLIGFHKAHTRKKGVKGLTYPEALDQALAFGWIDGVRKGLDADRYTIRFSPRRPKSVWSAVNVKRVGELTALGLMRPPGLAAFRARDAEKAYSYSYEMARYELAPAFERSLRANKRAWAFLQAQAPWYRRKCTFWVMSAKKEETRLRRLGLLIEHSARGERLDQLALPSRDRKAEAIARRAQPGGR
jgi:uncharacterized protein YdeI (YjbR/CyaY-like superfamily)